jgi:branched-chain amino acid transport system substrate-binding protein
MGLNSSSPGLTGDRSASEKLFAKNDGLPGHRRAEATPGIRVNTSPTNHHPLQQIQLQRLEGAGWVRFGEVI